MVTTTSLRNKVTCITDTELEGDCKRFGEIALMLPYKIVMFFSLI